MKIRVAMGNVEWESREIIGRRSMEEKSAGRDER